MKNIIILLNILLGVLLFSCEREYNNPYDRNCPPEIWTPENLIADTSGNSVLLNWEQGIDHFDGFLIERSVDSMKWERLPINSIDREKRVYTDSITSACDTFYYRIYATADKNISNYCYSNRVVTPIRLSSAITGEVTNITSSSAIFNGEITSDGGAIVTDRGFCYATTNMPDISKTKAASGSGTGIYTKAITELQPGTTYYVRAYATNGKGTAYGEQKTFATKTILATLITNDVTNITSSTATFNGEVKTEGESSVIERGFCYATTPTPDVDDSKAASGSGTGIFTKEITGLQPGTTYYVRAYATNSKGTAYGEQKAFTTSTTPAEVITNDVTDITTTTATFNGEVLSDGGATVTERGFCYATTSTPDVNDTKATSGSGVGTFIENIIGLLPETTYYVRAYAISEKGTSYGRRISFTTEVCDCNKNNCGSFTDTRDGHVYKTIQIGTQTWMAENLAYLPSVSSSASSSETTPIYYVYGYNGNSVNAAKATANYLSDGVLYNWPAAMNACPAGWHLPSDGEWTILDDYLTENGYGFNGHDYENAKSMAARKGWTYNGTSEALGYDPISNNSSCFTGLPAGFVVNGSFLNKGGNACWWSSSEVHEFDEYIINNNVFEFDLSVTSPSLIRNNNPKETGFSVRCLKGDNIPATKPIFSATKSNGITSNSVTCTGNITDGGGAIITARGFCWGTSSDIRITDNKTVNGSGIGSFTGTITGLSSGVTYFVRAYATNSFGTSYSFPIQFTTP